MQNKKTFPSMAIRTVAYSALLAAISVVMARLLSFAPIPEMRISLDKFPLFLSGLFFGPLVGGMVSFTADFIGCLFSPYGFNPIFSLTAIFYGVFGGLLRHYVANKPSPLRLALSYLLPVVIGSLLYQSAALAFVYSPSTFLPAFWTHLGTRTIQFAVTMTVEVSIIYMLIRTRVFTRLGIWPSKKTQ